MRFINKMLFKLLRPFAYIIGYIMPIQKNKIVVSSYAGKGYGDNPKYIVEQLLKLKQNFRIIWLLADEKDKFALPAKVEYCGIKTIEGVYHLMTAKIWIDNVRKRIRYKRKKQFYLNTWHGFALKRIEKDAETSLSKSYINVAKRDSEHIDLIVSCSRFMTNIYKKAFWYNGKIIETGAPRNDVIVNNDPTVKSKVHSHFRVSKEKGIILYAPTFRADKSTKHYQLEYNNLLITCTEKFKKEFVILVRLHPNISNMKLDINFDNEHLYNATHYPDMQELLCATDILITDYSSSMFDFAHSKKPCFLYATDIESYKNDRNFYFSFDELPFSISDSNDSLKEAILSYSHERYVNKVNTFFQKVGIICDGKASEKCIEIILKAMQY